jgi:hypothetical protein
MSPQWLQRLLFANATIGLWIAFLLVCTAVHSACGYPPQLSRQVRAVARGEPAPLLLLHSDLCPSLEHIAWLSPISLAKVVVDLGGLPMWGLLAARLWTQPLALGVVLVAPLAVYLSCIMLVRYVHFFSPFDPSGWVCPAARLRRASHHTSGSMCGAPSYLLVAQNGAALRCPAPGRTVFGVGGGAGWGWGWGCWLGCNGWRGHQRLPHPRAIGLPHSPLHLVDWREHVLWDIWQDHSV